MTEDSRERGGISSRDSTTPRVLTFLFALTALTLFTGCLSSPEPEKYYYTLRYDAAHEQPELIQREPIEARVWVRSASISRTYRRKQIVVRHFGPRISYLENHLWASELEDKVPELISTRLQAYELFSSIQRDFPYSRPEYELIPTITSLEFIKGDGSPKAALHMRLELRTLEGNSIVSTDIAREVPVYDDDLDSFVQVINETILEYSDLFTRDVLAYFDRAGVRRGHKTERIEEETADGNGQLLMPGIFEGREQPLFTLIEQGGKERLGRFGTPFELKAGTYTVRYGSGGANRKMHKKVTIRDGYRNIVEPDYGGLRVEIITPSGRPVELPYEVFDDRTGKSYGTGFSNESSTDWEERVWVLPTGRYKVTINNRPFGTTFDYTSAYVEKGKGDILTISVEKEQESDRYRVVGGGVIKEPLYADRDERWVLASSVAGNVAGTFNSRDTFADYRTGYNVNGFLQNRLRYDYGRYDFSMLNLVELGAVRTETGAFEATRDTVELDSTLIMHLMLRLGIYANADIRSHFLESHYRSDTSFDYEKLDEDGNLVEQGTNEDSVRTAPPFSPILFEEGLGLNLTLAERPRLEASTRVGLGFRQSLYGDSYPVIDSSSDPILLEQKEDEFTTGLESTIQLSTEFLRNLRYLSRLDAYAPFTDFENVSLEWYHELQLALARNFSIDYRATFYQDTEASKGLSVNSDQALYLRFSTSYRLSF